MSKNHTLQKFIPSALCFVVVASLPIACRQSADAVPRLQSEEEARVAGERGVPISASAPSFMPRHLTGPHAGKTACPVCVYGLAPQFQLWIEESKLQSASPLIRWLEKQVAGSPADPKDKRGSFIPYVVIAAEKNGRTNADTQRWVRSLGLKKVFFVEVPSWDHVETSALYGHSSKDRPGARGYLVVNRRVYQRWDNPKEAQTDAIERAWQEGRRFVSTYDVVDSQIAPAWEPGDRMTVRFRVVDRAGRPLANQKVNAYQTNKDGLYNPRGWNRRMPVLATTAWTNKQGWIAFDTIMPGPYPTRDEPSHIHFSTVVNSRTQFRTLWFEGDELLTRERRQWADRDKETVIVPIDRSSRPWKIEHTFKLD